VISPWLRRLAVHGRPVFHAAGHRLFRTDGPADRFWLIDSGAVVLDFPVPGRGDIVIERLRRGSVVGWPSSTRTRTSRRGSPDRPAGQRSRSAAMSSA